MTRIVDCTQYFCESHLWRLRLEEHFAGGVELLHVAEGDATFAGRPRRYAHPPLPGDGRRVLWHGVLLSETPGDAWARERALYDAALPLLEPGDVVLFSNMDELHCREDIPHYVDAAKRFGLVRIVAKNHYYKLNNVALQPRLQHVTTPVVVTYEYLRDTGRTLASVRKAGGELLARNSHHFDYCDTPAALAEKVMAFSHQEYNRRPFTDPQHIQQCMVDGTDLFQRWPGRQWRPEPLDDTYPLAVRSRPEAWAAWLA